MNHSKLNILLESNHHYLMAIHQDKKKKKTGESVDNFDDPMAPSSGAENIQLEKGLPCP